MIHWLVQTATETPHLTEGKPPSGLLSSTEKKRLNGLKIPKRRQEWLLGRWTAKQLLQVYLEQETGVRPPLKVLTVANDPDGAPFAALATNKWPITPEDLFIQPHLSANISQVQQSEVDGTQRLSTSLSISHSKGRAFCALSGTNTVVVGADIEHIEPRPLRFVQDYFTDREIALVRSAPLDIQDTVVTAIWSAKESVLKTLRLGLSIDTRRISCLLHPSTEHGYNPPSKQQVWLPFDVHCEPCLLKTNNGHISTITGWWRLMDEYVLTMAAFQL